MSSLKDVREDSDWSMSRSRMSTTGNHTRWIKGWIINYVKLLPHCYLMSFFDLMVPPHGLEPRTY